MTKRSSADSLKVCLLATNVYRDRIIGLSEVYRILQAKSGMHNFITSRSNEQNNNVYIHYDTNLKKQHRVSNRVYLLY